MNRERSSCRREKKKREKKNLVSLSLTTFSLIAFLSSLFFSSPNFFQNNGLHPHGRALRRRLALRRCLPQGETEGRERERELEMKRPKRINLLPSDETKETETRTTFFLLGIHVPVWSPSAPAWIPHRGVVESIRRSSPAAKQIMPLGVLERPRSDASFLHLRRWILGLHAAAKGKKKKRLTTTTVSPPPALFEITKQVAFAAQRRAAPSVRLMFSMLRRLLRWRKRGNGASARERTRRSNVLPAPFSL